MGNHPRRSAFLRLLALAAAALAVGLGPATRAEAHPMGPPQQATLTLASANQVQIVWKFGAMDDLSWLAYDLGLLPDDRIMLDGAITPDRSDAQLLQNSTALSGYLTRQMAVSSNGQSCQPEVRDTHDLVEIGATVVFTCPAPVTEAAVELKLLTDLEGSYATIATGPDGTQAVYNGSAPRHDWRFDPSTAPATSSPTEALFAGSGWGTSLLFAAAIGVPAIAGLGVWRVRSRPRSRGEK